MKNLLLLLVIAASISAGIAVDRAGWKYRKQLWQFQGAATGLIAGYLLGRFRLAGVLSADAAEVDGLNTRSGVTQIPGTGE